MIKEIIIRLGAKDRAADKCDFACLEDNSYKIKLLSEKNIVDEREIEESVKEITSRIIRDLKMKKNED